MTTVIPDTLKPALLFGCGLLALLAGCYWVYAPGLSGPLLLDDFWNLQPLGDAGGIHNLDNFLRFVFANDSGPTGRPVSMLAFLLDAQDWPPFVRAFKYTNLMLHLLTGVLLCWLTLLLARVVELSRAHATILGLAVAAFWLLHPLNVSTTLYVVQRMTQLMTLFTFAALISYLYGRSSIASHPKLGLLLLCMALFPFGLLAVLSKENGALLLLFIVVMETTLLRGSVQHRWFRLWYRAGVLLPLAAMLIYLILSLPANLELYDIRHFTLAERLLSEARALCLYLTKIFLPSTTGAGLFHDDFIVSTSLIQPFTTLVSILVIMGLLGSAVALRKSQAVYSFAVFWFFVAHLLESTYLPLELYFEHRNYLAMAGPLFACAWYARQLCVSLNRVRARGLLVLALGLLLWCGTLTGRQAQLWGNTLALNRAWAMEKPASVRAQISYADVLKYLDQPQAAMARLQLAHQHHPQELTILLYMWNLACESGMEAPYTLVQIANYPGLEYVRDDVNHYLKILLENMLQAKCVYPDAATMVSLFNKIGEFPLPDFRRAGYHFYFSDLYVFYGRLNPALINLTRAFEANPVSQIPIRQAVLSASANNYSDALIFLGRARDADMQRNPLLPSAEAEISRLETDFRQRLAAIDN